MIVKVFLRCVLIFFTVICTPVLSWAADPLTDEEKIAAIMPIIFGLLDSEPPTPISGSTTVAITNSNDDVEENTVTGALDKTSTDLELVYDNKQQAVGLRFQNVKIPQGATIKNAYIQFRTDEVSSSAVSLSIKGDKADNSGEFNSTAKVSSRSATTATVAWTPAAWTVVDEVSAAQRTPDLSAIVQEIVNQGGWAVNNAMSFIITGDGSTNKRVADSFEDGWAPQLVVDFEYINKAPVIASIPTTVIPKTSAINTQVLMVSASDPDGDALTYSIEGNVPFAIDATGKITLNAVPQPETHTFNVKVSDGKATTTVPVTVLTLLNVAHKPEEGFGVASQGIGYWSTGREADLAIDGNPATSNHTDCSATGNWWQVALPNPTQIRKIAVKNHSSWQSRLNGAVVYVTDVPYTTSVPSDTSKVATLTGASTDQVTDFITPKAGAYVIVKNAGAECLHMAEVEVYGQTASTPVFSQSAYTFYLNEKSTQGATAGTVKAVDYQLNPVTYRLVGNVPFAINAQGQITLNGTLNHNLIQSYSFSVEASDGTNVVTVPVTVKLGKGNGAWLQRWEGISGTSVDSLLQAAHYKNDAPDYAGSAAALDVKTVNKDNYGQKLTAFLVPEASGNYQFAIVGDDATLLKLSPNVNASQASKIAENGWGAYQDWNAAGKSALIALEAGKPYYIEALHKEGTGGDYVSVGWKREGDTSFTLIPAGQLYQDAMSVGVVIPAFTAGQRNYLIPWNTASGSIIASALAADPQGDSLTYSIVGSVPFRVDGQGNVSVNGVLQSGTTYTFDVSVTDGVHSVTTTLNLATTSTSAVEEALQNGDASHITDEELLDATLATITANRDLLSDAKAQIFNLNADGTAKADGGSLTSIVWNPTHDAAMFKPTYGMNTPVLMTNAVTDASYTVYQKEIGIIGEIPARYMVLGSNPMRNYYRDSTSINGQMQQFMENSLSWLSARSDLKTAPFNVVIAHLDQNTYFPDEVAVRNWLDQHYPGQVSYNAADSCDDVALAGCLATPPDLLIISQQMNAATNPAAVANTVKAAMAGGIPVLYLHLDGGTTNLGNALFPLFNVSYEWDNYYKKLSISAFNATQSLPDQPPEWVASIQTMLEHFKAQDYAFDWSVCDEGNCSAVVGLSTKFKQGAEAVRSMMNTLDASKINLFAGEGFRLQKLLALLGDSYRQQVTFPMDKLTTNNTVFLKSLFADHAVYNYRTLNPVQADMGNFSRSDFSHITPVTKTVNLISRQSFRAAGVYALPGQTFRVTRNDSSSTTIKVFVNTMNSGSTHEFEALGYKRPKFLRSAAIPLQTGETIAITSPYGGPIQIEFSANDQPVQLTFQQVGEHPFWNDATDNADFTAKLAQGDYDWAEFVTPAFEIHSTLEKMRESASDTRWGGTMEGFSGATMRYIHNFPHVLAGFTGPNIDVVSEIHDFATTNGYAIENLDKVKHMNADQASCGYGCSGNPYDAYWAFDPIGHGDIHEMGHGLEKALFRLYGWNYHASTNPYSYYSKIQFVKDRLLAGDGLANIDPDCQSLPFKDAFIALQASVGQANPAAYLKTNYWDAVSDNWSRAASMTIQMMMTAEHQGALQDGWHLLARLHILEREFRRVVESNNGDTWNSKRDSLGFSSYLLADAKDLIDKNRVADIYNDWMVIAVSKVTGLDYRDYFSMWGQAYSAEASAQVASLNYPAAQRHFFITSPEGYCKGEGFDGNNLPIDGGQVWPLSGAQPRLMGDSFR